MHMIDTSNDRNNIAFVGEVPWHGLGEQVSNDTTIEEWKVAAGLNWTIEQRPVFYGVTVGDDINIVRKAQVIDNQKALVRSDTQAYLSTMSDRYRIVQPGDVLEFYRDLVEGSRFSIETAGSLKGGKKIWALAKGNLDLRIGGQDLIKPYLLLATACDGTMSTVADFTTVRVVCNNTLTMAVGSNGQKAGIRVPHSRVFNPVEVKDQLGLVDDRFDAFGHDADRLANAKVSDDDAIRFFIAQYAKTDEDDNVNNAKHLKKVTAKLVALYRSGPGANLRSAHGTLWGVVNAITRFEDFDAGARSTENRFNSAQFGVAANRKKAAFDAALAMAA